MRYSKSLWCTLVVLLLMTLLLSACSSTVALDKAKQDGLRVNAFADLRAQADQYLKNGKLLYMEPQEVLAQAVIGEENKYVLVDIRNDEHYAFAHIPGAIHISYADAWREQKINYLPKDKKIIVIDYSGHTASQVAATWNMLGFDAVPMKYGMAGWSKDKDVVGGSPKGCQPYNFPIITVSSPNTGIYQTPDLEIRAGSLAEVIMVRAEAATKHPPVIQPKDLKENLKAYYIIDARQPEHFAKGHIEGAINIPFRTIAEVETLKRIPPDKDLAIVCYDGHAASQATRLLNLLGYHAVALKDGMSAWTADEAVIGAKPIACDIAENPVMKLNALLKPGPSTGAT